MIGNHCMIGSDADNAKGGTNRAVMTKSSNYKNVKINVDDLYLIR